MTSLHNEQDKETDSCRVSSGTPTIEETRKVVSEKWSAITDIIHQAITWFVITVSLVAAQNPKRTIGSVTLVSFTLIAVGFFTNFNLQVDYEKVYAPFGSLPISQKEWIDNESGFPASPRPFSFVIHNNGDNVLGREQIRLLFEALDTVRDTPGYHDICGKSTYRNSEGDRDCKIFGATRFWEHSADLFHKEIHSDEDAIRIMSAENYPGGTPVYTEFLFGYSKREGIEVDEGGNHHGAKLRSAKSLFLRIDIPDTEGADELEIQVLDKLMVLQKRWEDDPNIPLHLSYFTLLSYELEFERAINKDLILVPLVIIIMSAFTCLVFYKSDRVQSRSLLGLCSVAAVGLSLMSGYGLMFLSGVPFTSMSQILPFIVFGVGLDDTFIITGAYFRTNPKKDTLHRIQETMGEVGNSISLTTITTMSAFMLGAFSSIPAIRWVCLYAAPTMFIVFMYQISFFVACLVLDEQRVKANRKDICVCCTLQEDSDDLESHSSLLKDKTKEGNCDKSETKGLGLADGFMRWYSTQLMRPRVKVTVFVAFVVYFGFCLYRTTLLTQRFRTQDFVPEDSYVSDFLGALDTYSEQVLGINVYFKGVNQSDPNVQWEMRKYMQDLITVPAVNGTPSPFCWVVDFETRKDSPEFQLIKHMSFADQVTAAMNHPVIKEAYGDDIVQDEEGNIVASRCWLNPKYLDLDVVSQQIEFLKDQQAVSLAQPVNKGSQENMKFFTFDNIYFIFEFYAVAVNELVFTTISGMVAVSVIGFLLIEHWSATAFVLPMILVLYVDLLGTLQFAGLYINVVTYVCMVISIGLLVDFLMHIVLRYYESDGSSREAKVQETLQTMGASILVGGLSTFLGVIPLAFSTSAILRTVFTAFFAMVTLGLTHGLILLPVVLSLWGPTVCVVPYIGEPIMAARDDDGVEVEQGIFDDLGTTKEKMDEPSEVESITSDLSYHSKSEGSEELVKTCVAPAKEEDQSESKVELEPHAIESSTPEFLPIKEDKDTVTNTDILPSVAASNLEATSEGDLDSEKKQAELESEVTEHNTFDTSVSEASSPGANLVVHQSFLDPDSTSHAAVTVAIKCTVDEQKDHASSSVAHNNPSTDLPPAEDTNSGHDEKDPLTSVNENINSNSTSQSRDSPHTEGDCSNDEHSMDFTESPNESSEANVISGIDAVPGAGSSESDTTCPDPPGISGNGDDLTTSTPGSSTSTVSAPEENDSNDEGLVARDGIDPEPVDETERNPSSEAVLPPELQRSSETKNETDIESSAAEHHNNNMDDPTSPPSQDKNDESHVDSPSATSESSISDTTSSPDCSAETVVDLPISQAEASACDTPSVEAAAGDNCEVLELDKNPETTDNDEEEPRSPDVLPPDSINEDNDKQEAPENQDDTGPQ